jgi:ribonuclease HII
LSELLIAGVDEAGRGPLAGPLAAAAVILDPGREITGLADSKRLSALMRDKLEVEIKDKALCWSVAFVDPAEIDRINVLQASLLAMQLAVEGLSTLPRQALVDGNCCPKLSCPARAIIAGDATVPAISAASILAKVARDREMLLLDRLYPGYGFARHKGYPTAEHLAALRELGPCEIHRRSYRPVRELLGAG